MTDDEIERYNHVMYISKSHINQFFDQNVSEADKVTISESEDVGSRFELGIEALAKLNAGFSEETTRELIHEINFSDSYNQVKKAINVLSESDEVLPISALKEKNSSDSGLYHFDCPLQLYPDNESFGDEKFLNVVGKQSSVEFNGTTSWENWGSRSHAKTAMDAVDPYPFKGIIKPLRIEERSINSVTFSVQFLYILAPDLEDTNQWREYQDLLEKHPSSGEKGIK